MSMSSIKDKVPVKINDMEVPCKRSDGKISHMRFTWWCNELGGYTSHTFDLNGNLWYSGINLDNILEGESINCEY